MPHPPDSMQTLQQLLTLPEIAANFGPKRLQKLEGMLAEDYRSDMPWYLRFFVALGAWLASAFFIGFLLAITGLDWRHRMALGILGLALLAGATFLARLKLGIFANQCCLAASLTGQFFIYYGFLPEQHNTLAMAMAMSVGLAAALYWLYPDTVQRVIACVAALQITQVWIYLGNSGEGLGSGMHSVNYVVPMESLYWALQLAAIACCFLVACRSPVPLAPLGHALILAMVTWQLANLGAFFWNHDMFGMRAWNRAAILWLYYVRLACTALSLFGLVVWAAGGRQSLTRFALPYAGLACALAAIIWLGAGGILLPLLLITLGFFIESSFILGIGLTLLPIFVYAFYYSLRLDLLAKSVSLAGAGGALLLLRAGLRRWLPLEFKEAA